MKQNDDNHNIRFEMIQSTIGSFLRHAHNFLDQIQSTLLGNNGSEQSDFSF